MKALPASETQDPRRRTPIDWDVALDLRENEGWTFGRIARAFGYAEKTVRNALRARGAAGRPRARNDRASRKLRDLWRLTHEKCENPRHPSFPLYGARGVTVAEVWTSYEQFREWALASGYKVGLRLARLSDRKPFGPGNCRWVSAEERVHSRLPRRRISAARRDPSPIDWDEAKRLYLKEHLSKPAVARRLGCSYTGVLAGFRRLGIEREAPPAPTSTAEGRRLHKTWLSIHGRCENPDDPGYPAHGELGQRVAPEWSEFEPFLQWALANGARPGLWLGLRDTSRGYTPQNCVWTTSRDLLRQRVPPSKPFKPRRPITAFGESKGLVQWARDRRCMVTATTISGRLARGWDAASAITAPPQNEGSRGHAITIVEAFGMRKGLTAWTRDKRCRIGINGIADRLRRGWRAEDAISTPPHREPKKQRLGRTS